MLKFNHFLIILTIILLTLGVFFRFVYLDKKVYWHDEVFTTLHVIGYHWNDWKPSLFTGEIISVDAVQQYLKFNPHKGLMDTLNVLATDDPHHPPLYYILMKFWVRLFGDSISNFRRFSAIVSLLVFPAIYWLTWELFNFFLCAWIAVALVAVSPFFVVYAQEAREYALWTVLILLSTTSLLRGIRAINSSDEPKLNSFGFWGLYITTTSLGLYTSLFMIFVVTAQVIYLLIIEGLHMTKTLVIFLVSLLTSILLFSPWIIVFFKNYEQYQRIAGWTKNIKIPRIELLKYFGLNISRFFFDGGWEFQNFSSYLIVAITFFLVCYSLYFVYQNTSRYRWGIIVTLIGTQVMLLFVPDMIWGGVRSLSARYLVPMFIGINVVVAYLLARQLTERNLIKQKIGAILFAIIISSGIISCTINMNSNTSWTKGISYSLPQVAEAINQTDNTLLIGNDKSYNPGNILALSYLLKPEIKLQLLSKTNELEYQLPSGFKNIFLLSPSDTFRAELEQQKKMKVEWVLGDSHLWLWKINLL